MTRFAAWSLALAVTVCAGCSSNGSATSTSSSASTAAGGESPTSTGKPTGLLIEPVDALRLGYSIDWVTHLNVRNDADLRFAEPLGDLLVTIERPSNVMTAISMKTGRQLWRQQVGSPPYQAFAPTRMENTIVVNTETQLYEFDATKDGALVDRSDLRSAVATRPALVGDIAVFGGSDGMVFGHSTLTGWSKWAYKMPGQIVVPAQGSGSSVFVAGIDGQYAMFAGRSGEKLWNGRTFGAVVAPPVVHPSGVYVASKDHSLYALDRTTGDDRWVFRYTNDLVQSPVVLQNAVYQPLPEGELIALKVTDGTELWRLKTKDTLITQDSRGLLFNGVDKLVLRDASSRKVIEQIPVQGTLQHVMVTEDQSLIVISPQGRVMKLSPVK